MNHSESLQGNSPEVLINIDIDVGFVRIQYDRPHLKSHFIHFSVENQDQQQINYEQSYVEKSKKSIELNQITPLQMHLVMGPDKTAISPLSLFFISKLDRPIKRTVPIHIEKVMNYYLEHQIFENVAPLEQTFNFEHGVLTYWIHISKMKPIKNIELTQKYSRQFLKNEIQESSFLKKPFFEQQTKSKNMRQTAVESRLLQKDEEEDVDLPQIELKDKKSSLKHMSIEEIAQRLDIRRAQLSPIKQLSTKSSIFFKISKKQTEEEQKRLLESSNRKMKLAIVLLVAGFLFLFSDVIFGKFKEKSKQKLKKPKRAEKKTEKKSGRRRESQL